MKNFLLLLLLSLFSLTAGSQVVHWELSAEPGDQANSAGTNNSPNFTNSGLTRGAGVTATTGGGSMNSSAWFTGSTPTTLADAIAGNDYYEFTINTINCLFFNPTTLKIVLRSSATGPNTATLRCSSDGFSANIGTVTVTTTSTAFTFSESISPNSQSVTYRLYGYGAAAGGGTPSAGGTMRIGTSVVASDNDIEVFATTTQVTVTQVANITVTEGDVVPATVFTANVPGATIDWTRTPEDIANPDMATSGTGNLPSFSAGNSSNGPLTSTFTVHATVGNCQGPDMTFSITVLSGCEFLEANFSGSTGPCNDNGTPSDPSDDYFLKDVRAVFIFPPGDGFLQIAPGGDQIGVYQVHRNNISGLQHIFQDVKFKADGTQTEVQVNWTDEPACIADVTGNLMVQPCSNGGSCEIIGFSFNNIGQCNDNGTPGDDTDDFFTVDIDVLFSNSHIGTNNLQLGGTDVIGFYFIQPVPVGTNLTHTFTGVKLRADGQITDINASIVRVSPPAVLCELPGTGPSVNSCSNGGGACAFTNIDRSNQGPCDDNGTVDPTDDFFTLDVTVEFENPPATGFLKISPGPDFVPGGGDPDVPVGDLVGNMHTFTGIRYRADGGTTTIGAEFTADNNCIIGTNTGIIVEPCSFSPPVLTCPPHLTVSCANNVPQADPSDVLETHDCPGNVTITHLSDANSNVFCINKLTITRTYKGADQCGQTATCSQTITVNDQTPPTVTCPGPLNLTCVSQVPAVDVSLLGVTDNCAGQVGISRSFVGEVTSNQSCANRLTLTRTYKGGDACGNSATCTQVITVNDQTKPTMTCPINVTVSCASQVPAANTASVTGVGDNCGGTVTVTNFPSDAISNQTCANRFTITRSYFAVDVCNNSQNCTQTITVNDQTSPTITCPAPQTFSCAEQVPAPNPALVTGSDNCGGSITPSFFSNTISNQTCANRFTLTRQYRAADLCGNTSSCTQVITVNDQTPPVFTFVPANVTVDCYLIPGVGIATASDNCTSGATVVFLGETEVPGICPVWKILTRTWRATDVCGNSATASQVITVTDFNAPQFLVLPKNQVVECGPNNQIEFQAFLDNRGGSVAQDCAQITYSHEDSPFQSNYIDCGNTFHKNIRFIATDECGNSSFRDASFTVVDQTPPVFSTPPQSVDLECDSSDDNGENAFYDWLDSNAGVVAEDNCGEVELEKVQISEHTGCGNTWRKTYEFRAKDECGNISKTTATFAVVDHTPPTLACPPNDNLILSCIEDVPLPDPSSIDASDCSGVTTTLTDTWTNGTGCPGWMMTVAHRYTATDGCGNQANCERVFYVEETDSPTLVCPDTLKLVCVNDIPGPAQLFNYIKTQLTGDCAGGFVSIKILSDSGQPLNNVLHRTYTFTAKNHCGKVTSACSVTFLATGSCNQLCTASQSSWGDPNGTVAGMSTTTALQALLAQYGPVTAGGANHTVSASDAACVQEMLFGSGNIGFLPTGNFSCPLPNTLSNQDGSLNNQLAANALALQLNIWYNLHFINRDLGVQNLHNLPPCLVEFALLKDLAQNSTVQDLLNLTNQYLQGFIGNYPAGLPSMLNAALDNLNHFRVDCGLNAPCERPGQGRSEEASADNIWGINLVPNPAIDVVILSFESESAGEMKIQVSDGRALYVVQIIRTTIGNNTVEISLKDLPAGVFYLSLKGIDGVQTRRLVKVNR
ncbi:MAG: T9SS type A sorting domain-containing protein [Saprospiraceae bacterium]